jgi:hypothetical protein
MVVRINLIRTPIELCWLTVSVYRRKVSAKAKVLSYALLVLLVKNLPFALYEKQGGIGALAYK